LAVSHTCHDVSWQVGVGYVHLQRGRSFLLSRFFWLSRSLAHHSSFVHLRCRNVALSRSRALAVSLPCALALSHSKSLDSSLFRSLALSPSRSLALSLSRSLALLLSRSPALPLSRSLACALSCARSLFLSRARACSAFVCGWRCIWRVLLAHQVARLL